MRSVDWRQAASGHVAASLTVLCVTTAIGATAASAAKPKRMSVGHVTFVDRSGVTVDGETVKPGGKSNWDESSELAREWPLYPGNRIRTTAGGLVEFKLDDGKRRAYCRTLPRNGWVVVRPKSAFLKFRDGDTTCATDPAGGQKLMEVGTQIKLDIEGTVFKVVVRGRRSAVKVHKGAIVVSGQEGRNRAVVLGRRQETTVPDGASPSTPTPATFTKGDRQTFRQLDRVLPPVTDNIGPKPTLTTRPHDPSSLRRATFTFSTPEPATFSCAVDGDDFRLCESPLASPRLPPGRRTFKVRATDAAGNTGVTAYSWTIDGSRIAYTRRDPPREGPADIYVMDPDGENVLQLTDDGSSWNPARSPDARKVAFHRGPGPLDTPSDIWVMNADRTARLVITNGRNPTWSPDGSRIAFEGGTYPSREIYIMNVDGTDVKRLTDHPADDADPAWSPDGSKIAFASTRDAAKYDIYVVHVKDLSVTPLVTSPGQDFGPAWSPDGTLIAFHSDRDGSSSRIYLMNANGMGEQAADHHGVRRLQPRLGSRRTRARLPTDHPRRTRPDLHGECGRHRHGASAD